MSDPLHEDIVVLVNSLFSVDQFNRGLYSLEFRIKDKEFKSKFEELARKLENMNYVGKIIQMQDGIYIIVEKFTIKNRRKLLNTSWIPRILFVIVIIFVMIDGYFRTLELNTITKIGEPFEMAVIYTISLLGILGVHELGHLIAAKYHKLKTTWPYFIPGIPVYGFVPTFGAFIQSKGLTINRETLFDVAIAGPIAGLVVAVIVSLYGAYTMPIIDPNMIKEFVNDGGDFIGLPYGNSILFESSLTIFGKEDQFFVYTPVLWAAWIGFLITFLNLLPAWQLDGGHLARTLLGSKLHKYATYGSMAILILLGFWPMAMLIIILSAGNPSANPLDDISPLSRNRKLMYLGIICLAVLCAPLPTNVFAYLSS
jgi:Zn-dependent protease